MKKLCAHFIVYNPAENTFLIISFGWHIAAAFGNINPSRLCILDFGHCAVRSCQQSGMLSRSKEHRTHQARSLVDPYCRCQGTQLSEEGDIFSIFSGDRICRTLTIVSNAPLMFSDENRRALICNFLYKSYFQHSLDGCLTEINK